MGRRERRSEGERGQFESAVLMDQLPHRAVALDVNPSFSGGKRLHTERCSNDRTKMHDPV